MKAIIGLASLTLAISIAPAGAIDLDRNSIEPAAATIETPAAATR
jgi:hypothetical protein